MHFKQKAAIDKFLDKVQAGNQINMIILGNPTSKAKAYLGDKIDVPQFKDPNSQEDLDKFYAELTKKYGRVVPHILIFSKPSTFYNTHIKHRTARYQMVVDFNKRIGVYKNTESLNSPHWNQPAPKPVGKFDKGH